MLFGTADSVRSRGPWCRGRSQSASCHSSFHFQTLTLTNIDIPQKAPTSVPPLGYCSFRFASSVLLCWRSSWIKAGRSTGRCPTTKTGGRVACYGTQALFLAVIDCHWWITESDGSSWTTHDDMTLLCWLTWDLESLSRILAIGYLLLLLFNCHSVCLFVSLRTQMCR